MAMNVVKRDGRTETVMFDKIVSRISKLAYSLDPTISPVVVAQKVIQGVYDGVTTEKLDDLAAETAAYLTTKHPDYARLAARISVSNLHKNTDKSFSSVMGRLHKVPCGTTEAHLLPAPAFRSPAPRPFIYPPRSRAVRQPAQRPAGAAHLGRGPRDYHGERR